MTWDLRELAVIGMITARDHTPVTVDPRHGEEGWVKCTRCDVAWYVKRRAMLAELDRRDRVDDGGMQWANPLEFSWCSEVEHPSPT